MANHDLQDLAEKSPLTAAFVAAYPRATKLSQFTKLFGHLMSDAYYETSGLLKLGTHSKKYAEMFMADLDFIDWKPLREIHRTHEESQCTQWSAVSMESVGSEFYHLWQGDNIIVVYLH